MTYVIYNGSEVNVPESIMIEFGLRQAYVIQSVATYMALINAIKIDNEIL